MSDETPVTRAQLGEWKALCESISPTSGVVERTVYIGKSKLAIIACIAEIERLRQELAGRDSLAKPVLRALLDAAEHQDGRSIALYEDEDWANLRAGRLWLEAQLGADV